MSYVQKIQVVKKNYFLSFDKCAILILSTDIATLAQVNRKIFNMKIPLSEITDALRAN